MEVGLLSLQLLRSELLLVLPLNCSQRRVLNLEEALRQLCPLELHLPAHMVIVQQRQLHVIVLRDVA